MSTPATARSSAPASTAAPVEEARRLYRAVMDAEPGPDHERFVRMLKGFLAGVEAQGPAMDPYGEEVGRYLDDAAMALYRNGHPGLARRAVNLGLALQPGSVSLLHHKALVLLAQNQDLEEVVQLVDQALAASPHDGALWGTRGDAFKMMGKTAEAVAAYRHAQEQDASSTQYVDRALKLAPNDPAALRMKVDLAQALGGDVSALEAADELLKGSPSDPGLLTARAHLLATLGRPADALTSLDAIPPTAPPDDGATVLRVRLLYDLDRDDDARAAAKTLAEREAPPSATHLGQLADLTHAKAPEVSLRSRERLAEADPRNLQNLHELYELAVHLDRVDVALATCQAILATQPDNLEAMSGVAELEAAAGHADLALAAYRVLRATHPQAVVELRRALELARQANQEGAVREFAEALLAEDPNDLGAQVELARALAATGDTAGALKAYDTLLAAHPGQLPYLLEKKEVLASTNDPAQLAPVLDEVFRLDPTRTDIAIERGNLYLALAYGRPEDSPERDHDARTALVAYERASNDSEAAAVAELGVARASRLIGDPDRAIRSYEMFLDRPENSKRSDVQKELAHALRETGRYSAARELYLGAIAGGVQDPDVLWGVVEVFDHLNEDGRALRMVDLLLRREPKNTMYLRKQGQLLLRSGKRDEALEVLRRVVEDAHGDAHAYFEVGEALRSQGAYTDAIGYFRHGLEVDPKNRHGRVALAEALGLAGQYSEVVAVTDPLLKEDPNDVAAWKARADAWRALGRPSEVLYSLKAILLLEPDDPECLLEKFYLHRDAGEGKDAYETLSRLLASPAPEAQDPTLHLERGDLAAGLGLVEEANHSYERAAEIDPSLRPEIVIRRAHLRLTAGRPDLALEVLEQGKPPSPDGTPPNTGLELLRAEILTALERPSEARAVYEDVLARDAKSPVALAGVGRTMLDEGRHAEAAEFLRHALPKAPPHEPLYLLLAEAESGAGRLERAEEELEQGTRALPKSAPLWSRLGEVAIARQNWAGAAGAYQHALAIDPSSPTNLLRAGFVAERLNHPNEALAFYERATESEPSNPQAWTSRGLALLATGRAQDASTSFDRALALDSDFAPAKDGRKLAAERTRDQQVQKYGREALLLEARVNRPVAKNDLFVTLHVPFEFLEPVLGEIGKSPAVDLDRMSPTDLKELETSSYHLISAALEHRPAGIEHRGLTLADVAVLSPPTASLDQLQRLFGYLRAVLEADLRAENLALAPDVEELARKALVLPAEQRTLFQLVRTLRVGIYKARLIKVVEEAGATVRSPLPTLDLGAYSPEFRGTAPRPPPGAVEAAEESGATFFSPETAPAPSPGATARGPAGTTPSVALAEATRAAPGGGPRCVGCGGIASVRHGCGAPLCQHCIGQFPHCPKCGHPVSVETVAPLGGVTVRSSAPTPLSHARSVGGGLQSMFRRSRPATKPPPARPPATAPTPAPTPARPPAGGPAAPPAHKVAAMAPPSTPAVKDASAPPKNAPEPPAPPPPRPRRDKPDDEPRL